MAREEPLVRSDGWPPRSASGGGRDWWAHFEFTRINIELIILRKKIEDLRYVSANCPVQDCRRVRNLHSNFDKLDK